MSSEPLKSLRMTPQARLEASRAELRRLLTPKSKSPRSTEERVASTPLDAGPDDEEPFKLPSAVSEGLWTWWNKRPLPRFARLAGKFGAPVLASMVRKKPKPALLISAGIGALLIVVPLRPMLFKALRLTLFSGLLFEVAKASAKSFYKK